MKHFIPFLFSFLVFTGMVNAQDKDFHIYLAFGQSNMEGSAKVEEIDQHGVNPRFMVMNAVDKPKKAGRWASGARRLLRSAAPIRA